MKTLFKLIILTIALVVTKVSAQDFQGVATYKSHRKFDFKLDEDGKNSEMRKQLHEQLKKQFQQEYTLTFDKNQSLYKKNEKLATPSPVSNGIQITVSDGSDLLYKNIKENRFVNETEIYGKQFLIKDSLSGNQWKLGTETKNIGEYTCFNATFEEEYKTQKLTDDGNMETVTKTRITTAWYTPQIPVSNGPQRFQGLPGLILEINDGKLTLICSKLVINPGETIEINEPKKGKEVTQKEFDEIMEKKSKEMMENMRSSRGDGDNVIISIGG